MKTEFTAIVIKDGDWWLGWIEEIPGVNAQEQTKEELMISLKEAAKDILEIHRIEARKKMNGMFGANGRFEEISLAL